MVGMTEIKILFSFIFTISVAESKARDAFLLFENHQSRLQIRFRVRPLRSLGGIALSPVSFLFQEECTIILGLRRYWIRNRSSENESGSTEEIFRST